MARMIRSALLGLIACGFIVAAPARAQAPQVEKKVALVIGNSAYPTANLRNPVNDASAMAGKLRALGFDVLLRTDLTQREMTRSFSQFGEKLGPGAVALFYFAGHGLQVQGKNFLIPVDAEIRTEASVRTEAVDVDLVLHQLGTARLSMVILDACRNNPFERRFRGTGGGLAQIDAPTGTLIAYATAPGKTADDGLGSNGLYTTELLKAIDMQGLTVEEVFKQVRINVLKASRNQQIPWESSSLTGEFFFRVATKAPASDEKLVQAERQRAELVKSIDEERRKREQDAEAMRLELEKLRADLAKVRETLPGAPPKGPPPKVATEPSPKKPASRREESAPAVSLLVESAPEPPRQVAIAPSSSLPAGPAPSGTDWSSRLDLLEKSRDKMSYSRAVAILLDVASDEELGKLLRAEGALKRHPWNSAYALGIDRSGRLCQGWHLAARQTQFAVEVALSACKGGDRGDTCRVILVNGELQEKALLELAQLLASGSGDVSGIRAAYLDNLPGGSVSPERR